MPASPLSNWTCPPPSPWLARSLGRPHSPCMRLNRPPTAPTVWSSPLPPWRAERASRSGSSASTPDTRPQPWALVGSGVQLRCCPRLSCPLKVLSAGAGHLWEGCMSAGAAWALTLAVAGADDQIGVDRFLVGWERFSRAGAANRRALLQVRAGLVGWTGKWAEPGSAASFEAVSPYPS